MKYIKQLIHLAVVTSVLFSISCSKKEDPAARQARIQQAINAEIENAQEYLEAGKTDQAMAHLEELLEANPNNVEILKALAMGYSVTGESALAAFYFEQTAKLDKNSQEFRIFAALAYSDINDWTSASRNYSIYLDTFPNDLPTWKALANAYSENKQPEEALQAYLKAANLSRAEPSPEDALKIGKLYQKINLPSDSKPWFEKVHEQDPSNTEALVQLIKIECLEEDYVAAEGYLKKLKRENPALAASATLRAQANKINKWRRSQDNAMALISEVKSIFEEPIDSPEPQTVAYQELKASDEDSMFTLAQKHSVEPVVNPSSEDESDYLPQEIRSTTESREPLPEESIFDAQYKLAVVEEPEAEPREETVAENVELPTEAAEQEEVTPRAPLTAEACLEKANELRSRGLYDGAIKYYWEALTIDPKPSATWHELSHTYSETKDYDKAEMTALESVRRNPSNIHYKMHYLKVIQMSRTDDYVLSELRKAKTQFPENLDITLALARGYASKEDRRHDAIQLYKEFIQKAPVDHPRKQEAERALDIIR